MAPSTVTQKTTNNSTKHYCVMYTPLARAWRTTFVLTRQSVEL